ncbi:hypothetical protein VBD025_07080 [Virgibacillus flavescens]|uniref:hypothetical protein n=1 Tax=Virgibacillus flavescens TaxID=1611422 RepID=UPI003D3271B3
MEKNNVIHAVCFTADVIDSRKNGKEAVLDEIAVLLNEKHSKTCLTPFTKRAGDEIFGVASTFADAYIILKDLFQMSEKKGVPLYVGVGLGTVKEENVKDPNTVNGSAVWNAADALKLIKENSSKVKNFRNDASTFRYFVYADEGDIPHMLVNYMTSLVFEKIEKRTAKQAEVIEIMESFPSLSLEAVGNKVGYQRNASTNISKLLHRAEYHVVHGAEVELINFLAGMKG